jgi:hypothetical protein
MAFQKVEFSFPDPEQEDAVLEVEGSSEVEIDLSGKKTAEDYKETEVEPEVETAATEEDIEIEVVDDTPKADRNRRPSEPPKDVTDEELANYSKKVQQRIKHFSKGYHDERRAKEQALREREELERLAQKLVDENKELKGNVNRNQEALLEQAKKAVAAELLRAKQIYKDAYESGEADKVIEAQETLTSAKIKSDKLNNFKVPPLQEEKTSVQDVTTNAQQPYDARAEEWRKENSWFDQDEEMTSLAVGLHHKLVRQGVDPTSDEYYERIDARMREVFPEEFEDASTQVEEKPKPRSNVVAPATRSTGPKKVILSPSQMALSKRLGITPQEYAKQVVVLERGNQ